MIWVVVLFTPSTIWSLSVTSKSSSRFFTCALTTISYSPAIIEIFATLSICLISLIALSLFPGCIVIRMYALIMVLHPSFTRNINSWYKVICFNTVVRINESIIKISQKLFQFLLERGFLNILSWFMILWNLQSSKAKLWWLNGMYKINFL
jgi:hypothetical protein